MAFTVEEISELRRENYRQALDALGQPADEQTASKALKAADLMTQKQVGDAMAWQRYKSQSWTEGSGRNPFKLPHNINDRRSAKRRRASA
ncbi:hypothetical protein [Ilumatobacter sp.]|uniref:hypothetical protein n=1 Tax=Ilumatobacter sp. TaxID=1967498 RepID=UPI00375354DC